VNDNNNNNNNGKKLLFSSSEGKSGTAFRSSTDEILETLTWNNKIRQRKESMY